MSSPSRTSACAPPTSRRPAATSTCRGRARRPSQLISEFSRSDLMLGRRGFLGASLALSAGPGPHRADAALAGARPRRRPGGRRRTSPAPVTPARRPSRLSEQELELLESTTVMFREWDDQCGGGLRRKAVVGQLHEVTDLLQEPQPEAVARRLLPDHRRPRRAGRLDELRRGPAAHRAEVLGAGPARGQGGGRPPARRVHPVLA